MYENLNVRPYHKILFRKSASENCLFAVYPLNQLWAFKKYEEISFLVFPIVLELYYHAAFYRLETDTSIIKYYYALASDIQVVLA